MRIKLFKLLLFFCICIPAYGMNKELSLIADSTPSDDIAYDIIMQYVSKVRREKPQPISERDMYHGLIRNYTAKGNSEKAIELCEKIEHKIPYDTSILTPDHKKKCDNILAIMENSALNGNNRAQNLITKRSLESCTPFLYKNHQDEITYALNYFTFLLNLTEKKIPIITPNPAKDKIMQMIEHGYPELQVILRACRCLQATEGQKQITDHLFLGQACPNSPLIELTCKYLLEKIDTQTFVTTLKAQKKIPHITDELKKIACMPICPKIIDALKKVLLKTDSSLTPDIDYFLAILFEKQNDIVQANNFYTKVIESKSSYSKHQTTITSAIKARLASIETISNEDIIYFSKKFENIYAQLEKIEKTNPNISYKLGLLIDVLLSTIKNMYIVEKTNVLLNGLEHLIYAQDNHTWSKKIVKKITTLCFEFEISLSDIYQGKNDSVTALKHLENGIKHHAQNSTNRCDNDIINILIEAQKQDIVAYDHYAPYILALLNYRYNAQAQQYNDKQKNYSALRDFAHSDLAARLLSYCECLYKEKESVNNTTSYLLALIYKNKGDNNKAYDYIATVLLPTPKEMLFDKAAMYIKVEKPLSLIELKNIFKLFIKTKTPSQNELEVVSSLVHSTGDLFTLPTNHTLALELITKLASSPNMLQTAIEMAFYVTKNILYTNNHNDVLKQWFEKISLPMCPLYTEILNHEPSYYSPDTNDKITLLLIQSNSPCTNAKILSYFSAAQLLPENNAKIRYKKAHFLLNNADDIRLINYALELFEENIKLTHSENDTLYTQLSLIALSEAYLNCTNCPEQEILLQKLIPFDADKAIQYLKLASNDNIKALVRLTGILAGTSKFFSDPTEKEKHKDVQEAIKYATILLERDPTNKVNNASILMKLYTELNNSQKVLEYINLMLQAKDLSNRTGVTQEELLRKKVEILIDSNPNDDIYNQILDCFRQLFLSKDSYLCKDFNALPLLKNRTLEIVSKQKMDTKDIEWCCFSAAIESFGINQVDQLTEDQKNLSEYLLSAAKIGNLDAQLTLLPYMTLLLEDYTDMNYFVDAMTCTHEALSNPKLLQYNKEAKVKTVLDVLFALSEAGDLLAYYLLCDYHQKDTKLLEKIMLTFSQAKGKYDYLEIYNQPKNVLACSALIRKICSSSRETFLAYAQRYINKNNKKKLLLIDAIGTFTLGSMYHFSDDELKLTAGSFYLKSLLDNITSNKTKLPHCRKSIQALLSSMYYKTAITERADSVKNVNLHLLRQSAQLGFRSAVKLLAELWIKQNEDDESEVTIEENDFVPSLIIDAEKHNASAEESLKLFIDYTKIKALQKKKVIPTTKPVKISFINNTNRTISDEYKKDIEASLGEIYILARNKKIIFHERLQQSSAVYTCKIEQKKQTPESLHLLEYGAKQNNPVALLALAFHNLAESKETRDYCTSLQSVEQMLLYGLKPKQLYDFDFLQGLCFYISLLDEHPSYIKNLMISNIIKALEENEINCLDFSEIFKKLTNKELPLVSTKKLKSSITGKDLPLTLSDQDKSTHIEAPIKLPQCFYINDSNDATKVIEKIKTTQDLTERLNKNKDENENPFSFALNKNIILHIEPEQSSHFFTSKIQPNKQDAKTLKLLEYGAKQNNPIALLALAFHYLSEEQETKKYVKSIQLLNQTLLHGLAKKQFYDYNFLDGFCSYISSLERHAKTVKESILYRIIQALKEQEINLSDFSEIFQKITGQTLLLVHESFLDNHVITPLNLDNIEAIATLMRELNPHHPEYAQNQNGVTQHKKNKNKRLKTLTKK